MAIERWIKFGKQPYVGFPEPMNLDHLPLRDESNGEELVEAYWEPSREPFGEFERVLRPAGSRAKGLEEANRDITQAEYDHLDDVGRELIDYARSQFREPDVG